MAEEWEIDVWVYADTAKVATDAALDKHPGSEVIFVERYKEGQFRITLASHTPFLPEEE